MADKKISQLTSLAQGDIATTTDVLAIVDTSATETKKATPAAIVGAAAAAGLTNVDINSGAIDGTTIGANSAAAGTFTTLTGSTKTVSPFFDAVGSAGGQLRNASGTSQLAWGAGGGSNLSLEVATNINPANANVSLAPTGTGTVTINPATAGTMNNVAIGGTTAAAGSFTTLTTSSTVTLNGGTANGVLYLNGSKVATSGSGFTYDGTSALISGGNLRVDRATNTTTVTLGGSPSANWEGDLIFATSNTQINWRIASNRVSGGALTFTPSTAAGGSTFTTPAMIIDNASNVGIGTTSPSDKLHVVGLARINTGTYAAGYGLTFQANAETSRTYKMGMVTGGNFAIYDSTAAEQRVVLDTSGNVGLGTASPGSKLDVRGANSNNLSDLGAQIVNAVDTTAYAQNNGGGIGFGYVFNSGGSVIGRAAVIKAVKENATDGNYATSLVFANAANSANTIEKMRLDSSGNLGLGVTPNVWLSSFRAIQLGQGSSLWGAATGNNAGFDSNAYVNTSGGSIYVGSTSATRYQQNDGKHLWYTSTDPTPTAGNPITFTQAMTLDASGNLGVGISPGTSTRRLIVYGSTAAATATALALQTSTSGTGSTDGFTMELAGTTAYLWNYENDALLFGTNNAERARITAGGDFLVAKTTSDSTVVGCELRLGGGINSTRSGSTNATSTMEVYSTGAGAYRFYVAMDGTVSATNTTISAISDARLKENVRDLDVGLDAILALKPRTFDWKEGKGKNIKDDRGWIAQEFEQVFPDMIDTWKDPAPEGEEPYKSVRADLIPVLVKAMQEQQAMIETLKAKVAALEAK